MKMSLNMVGDCIQKLKTVERVDGLEKKATNLRVLLYGRSLFRKSDYSVFQKFDRIICATRLTSIYLPSRWTGGAACLLCYTSKHSEE